MECLVCKDNKTQPPYSKILRINFRYLSFDLSSRDDGVMRNSGSAFEKYDVISALSKFEMRLGLVCWPWHSLTWALKLIHGHLPYPFP